MKVKRLDGRQLNHWVAKSAGLTLSLDYQNLGARHNHESGVWHPHPYNPANDWSQAGPIVSGEWVAIEDALMNWFGPQWPHIPAIAENPLKWFMRAYVATQFGDDVEDTCPIAENQPAPGTVAAALDKPPQHNWLIPRWFR